DHFGTGDVQRATGEIESGSGVKSARGPKVDGAGGDVDDTSAEFGVDRSTTEPIGAGGECVGRPTERAAALGVGGDGFVAAGIERPAGDVKRGGGVEPIGRA